MTCRIVSAIAERPLAYLLPADNTAASEIGSYTSIAVEIERNEQLVAVIEESCKASKLGVHAF